MSRGVWFVAGAAAGVYGAVRARRAAETFTPDGLRDRAAGLTLGVRLFADEVRLGAVEKEAELRERLELRHETDALRELHAARSRGDGAPGHDNDNDHGHDQRGAAMRSIARGHHRHDEQEDG